MGNYVGSGVLPNGSGDVTENAKDGVCQKSGYPSTLDPNYFPFWKLIAEYVPPVVLEQIPINKEEIAILGSKLKDTHISEDWEVVTDPVIGGEVAPGSASQNEHISRIPKETSTKNQKTQHHGTDPLDKENVEFKLGLSSWTNEQKDKLEQAFLETQYPDIFARECLENEIGIAERGIQIWFANRRVRWRRQMKDESKKQMQVPFHCERCGHSTTSSN